MSRVRTGRPTRPLYSLTSLVQTPSWSTPKGLPSPFSIPCYEGILQEEPVDGWTSRPRSVAFLTGLTRRLSRDTDSSHPPQPPLRPSGHSFLHRPPCGTSVDLPDFSLILPTPPHSLSTKYSLSSSVAIRGLYFLLDGRSLPWVPSGQTPSPPRLHHETGTTGARPTLPPQTPDSKAQPPPPCVPLSPLRVTPRAPVRSGETKASRGRASTPRAPTSPKR